MTLVELLVVIIILTTIVGGVIPVLSPNNDSRKIRAASRGLQGYIAQIQAKAARTGRPHGIGFRETAPESGVAIEVFGLEVPPPFAGFSTSSRVRIIEEQRPGPGNQPNLVYYLQFVLTDIRDLSVLPLNQFPPQDYAFDPVPPGFVRVNDTVEVNGHQFPLIINDNLLGHTLDDNDFFTALDQSLFLCGFYPSANPARAQGYTPLSSNSTLSFVETFPLPPNTINGFTYRMTAPMQYTIRRQPTNSSEAPYQLPASIALDLQGSILVDANFDVQGRFDINFPFVGESLTDRQEDNQDTVGILFSPTGAVSSIFHNNLPVASTSRVMLLLGRIENGGLGYEHNNRDNKFATVDSGDWTIASGASKKDLEDLQESVNWLNLESRFLSIATANGRVVVSEPAFVDATAFGNEDPDVQFIRQLEAAQEFAQEMTTVGGN